MSVGYESLLRLYLVYCIRFKRPTDLTWAYMLTQAQNSLQSIMCLNCSLNVLIAHRVRLRHKSTLQHTCRERASPSMAR